MPIADNSYSTLDDIRTKVRRLTKSPSSAQITNKVIDEYINTFVLYDFPGLIQLFSLKKTLTFYTEPYIDVYKTNTTDAGDPLYNFKNKYISIQSPIYISGQLASFFQDRVEFFANNPQTESEEIIATGNGLYTVLVGTLSNPPLLRNKVLFSTIATDNTGLEIHDDGDGNLDQGDAVVGPDVGDATIDYVTGEYDLEFTSAPKDGESVYSSTIPYTANKPTSVLYFNDEFTLRPVPDRPYRVEVTVMQRPTELLTADQTPDLAQWWQYIALGAARKILQDRMDTEALSLLEPSFKEQQLLVLRSTTIMQQTQQQVSTIYNSNLNLNNLDNNTTDV